MAHLHFDKQPHSICILRLSAIGDVTHVLPVIATLREYWPRTRITWIIGAIEYELVKSLSDIEFIVFNKKNGWREFLALRRKLAGRRFDVLLMMQVALRANLISLLIRARHRIGYDRDRSRDFHGLFCNHRIEGPARVHVLDTFFQFLEKMGLRQRRMDWLLQPGTDDNEYASKLIGGKPSIIINPCSSARRNNWRNWPVERYSQLIDRIVERYALQVILTGGPSAEEKAYSKAISAQCISKPINKVGATTLGQLLALMQRALLVIAPDTGPAHMATVAGTPVVGLYASSNPRRTGPYLSQAHVVDRYREALEQYSSKRLDEARWGERVRNPKVMNLISVEDVESAISRLVSGPLANKQSQISPKQ